MGGGLLQRLLLWLYFVAAKIFLGLDEYDMLAQLGAVLAECKLFRGVHGVLGSIIDTLTRLLAHEAD